MKKAANAQATQFTIVVIIQLICSQFLKSQLDKLWIAIITLQIIVYFPIYQVNFPSNTLIFLEAMRKIAEGKVIDPDKIIAWLKEKIGLDNKFEKSDGAVAEEYS